MNIIESVKQIITDYPKIAEFTNEVHVDFTDESPASYGIAPTGDQPIKEDIMGNQTRKHSFVLYAVSQSILDYDRLENSTFLLELGYYLETIKKYSITATVGTVEKQGYIKEMSCANAMAYSVPTGNLADGIKYQLQIYATYYLESEE
jgi:hypothetical protein